MTVRPGHIWPLASAYVTSPNDPSASSTAGGRAPAPLLVAASLVAVEAALLTLQGIAEIFSIADERLLMGLTTSVFFVIYGAGLGICAWAVSRLRSWARAPIVVAQLIQLLVAWSFGGASTMAISVTLALVAVLVLFGLFHPVSIRALADADGLDGAGDAGPS